MCRDSKSRTKNVEKTPSFVETHKQKNDFIILHNAALLNSYTHQNESYAKIERTNKNLFRKFDLEKNKIAPINKYTSYVISALDKDFFCLHCNGLLEKKLDLLILSYCHINFQLFS